MFFFVGWPKVTPLKNSEVVDIEHNPSKVWTVVLTKNRISIWTFALNENILLGFLKRSDIDKYGENHFILWSYDSRKIAVITTKLCVYLYNIEEINEFIITASDNILMQNSNNNNINSLIPKIKKIRIIPYKLLHLMKLPPYSTITRACHLTNDVFVISTNYAQFIHIHWKGHVELTCQLNLKNKVPIDNNNNSVNNNDNTPPITPSKPNENPNWGRPKSSLPLARNHKSNDSIGIVDLSMSSKLGIMVVVFESGSCWIIPLQKLSKNVSIHNLSVNQTTYVSEYENVTCCDICDRFHFLSLGLSNGNVIIYHLHLEFIECENEIKKKLQFRLELLVIFSAHEYNLIPVTYTLDSVREVSWSDSGNALAISWKKGIVVYSVRGIVIFSTLHNQIEKEEEKKEEDPITTYYPSCLKWLQKDTGFLMCSHKNEVTKDDFNHYLKQYEIEKRLKQQQQQKQNKNRNENKNNENENESDESDSESENDSSSYKCLSDAYLIQIKCLKHLIGNLCGSDQSKLGLLGSNYISIWRPVHIIDDPESTDYWSRIEIDSYYLSHNWPIRELCINNRSDCICIAGSTGFAMYFRKTGKWKCINSLNGENILFICVMCWLTNDLILIATFNPSFLPCSNQNNMESKWNLLCFDRYQIKEYINENNIMESLLSYPLTNHPIGMECVDNNKLLIYFVDGVIHIYDITIGNGNNQKITMKNYCVLAPFQTLSPHPVSLRIWNYSSDSFCILSLSADRNLYRINILNNERELIISRVHDFYLMRETRDRNDKCYLWTYSNDKVSRWEIVNNNIKSLYVSPIQSHMTCIGICNTLNVLVYARRIIRKIQPLYIPRFAIHIDIRSYLHITISEKLNSIGLDATFDFVLKAIAGGAWRCLNALEHILRSSLQKRYKIKQKKKQTIQSQIIDNTPSDGDTQSQNDNTLPFDSDAVLLQGSLRSTYVFYPNDVQREFSRQNLKPQQDEEQVEKKQPEPILKEKEEEENESSHSTLMMMNTMSFEKEKEEELKWIENEEKEIDIIIKFLKKFPDYPGIVVNVARKTEPSQWNDLYMLCGNPIILINKSIERNQLATASKYLYVFEKIQIEYAIHYATLLIEMSIKQQQYNLCLSLLRFSHKLKLMIKESHENNIEIPQLNINIHHIH